VQSVSSGQKVSDIFSTFVTWLGCRGLDGWRLRHAHTERDVVERDVVRLRVLRAVACVRTCIGEVLHPIITY
jgi:hypothetical protein